MWLLATLQIAVASAVATTFDDNIYLTTFFGKVDRSFRPLHVVVGELLGVSFLITLGLLGSSLGVLFPRDRVGLLGLIPLLIGVWTLLKRVSMRQTLTTEKSVETSRERKEAISRISPGFISRRLSLLDLVQDRRTYGVSVVTISNGSNNLSIYIPLFASLSTSQLFVVVPTIYASVLCWLMLSFSLTKMPGLSLVLNRYAKTLHPFVLIWLGFRILSDSGNLERLIAIA